MARLLTALAAAFALVCAAPAIALAQDAAQGRAVFQADNGHSMIGPNLWGVAGRKAGSVAGFPYSPALQHANMTWTADQLSAFVQAPTCVAPGTRMPFAGLHNPQQAAALATCLATLH